MPPPPAERPFAVVDIGSNSVRLVVYDRLARSPIARFNEKSMCGLGRGLARTGKLDEGAVRATLQALRRFALIGKAMEVDRLDIVATEAARRAENGPSFLEAAEAAAGVPIEVLSGEGEARTAATGVAWSFYEPAGIVGDLGGGSVEFAFVAADGVQPSPTGSLPLGTLPLGAMLAESPARAEAHVDETLARLPWLRGAARGRAFYVVGGGWRALARIHLVMTESPLHVVHDYAMAPAEVVKLGRTMAAMPAGELAGLPGMPKRRIETVPAAAHLLAKVVGVLEPERVVFSAFGLREGRLFQHLPPEMLDVDPLLAGARDFARARARSPGMGAAMLRWTSDLFAHETAAERRLRQAACELSDIGWREHPGSRALESFFRLVQYPFIGLGPAERVFIAHAIMIRYEGDPKDAFLRPFRKLMSAAARRRAEILGTALQLGYRLSAAIPDLLEGHKLAAANGELRLRLASAELAPDDELLNSRLKSVAKAMGAARHRIIAGA